MKNQYCWRCEISVPMLSDDEYRFVCTIDRKPLAKKHFEAFLRLNDIENHVELNNLSKIQERFRYMIESYRVIGGLLDLNPNSIFHHQLSQHGPLCPNCEKPLRTKLARYCASCGFGKEDFISRDTLPLLIRRSDLFEETIQSSTFIFPDDKIEKEVKSNSRWKDVILKMLGLK